MDIETLRRANEALSRLEEARELLDFHRSAAEKSQHWVQILEGRIAGCKQTLMECGVAEPVTPVTEPLLWRRDWPSRTLESEGQKWDEEARARQSDQGPMAGGKISGRMTFGPAARLYTDVAEEHHGC